MKQIWITACALCCCYVLAAQQTQGRIVYEQVMKGGKSTVNINGQEHTMDRPEHINKLELLFGNEQSLLKPIEEERPDDEMGGGGRGMVTMRFGIGPGMGGIVYHHFPEERRVEQQESMGKKFLIADSVHKQTWKITGATKTIMGFVCQQATTSTVGKSRRMRLSDGEMKSEDVADTTDIIAWFAPGIPVAAGPDYQGQLPGMILELAAGGGSMVYRAVEVSPKVNLTAIKAPTGGKKVTREQYRKEMDELMNEMMKRGPGAMPARRAM